MSNPTRDHFLHSLAINAVTAAMAQDKRVLLTSNDAQRVEAIYALLHLDKIIEPEGSEPEQVAPKVQPPENKIITDIEQSLAKLAELD